MNTIITIVITSMLTITSVFASCQSTDEWLKQKDTQIKYLMDQIAALKSYGEEVNKGFDIAHTGISNVSNSKSGDCKLHGNYLLSLWKVKTVIKNYKCSSILKMQDDIEKQFGNIKASATKFLYGNERDYINKIYTNQHKECDTMIMELNMVIGDDYLQLKDDERIQRIDKIYLKMQDHYEFSRSFASAVRLLVLNRIKGANDTASLNFLFGLK